MCGGKGLSQNNQEMKCFDIAEEPEGVKSGSTAWISMFIKQGT
jgi:hypothetical protein